MNILLVCDYFSPYIGGIEKLFSDLAFFLAGQGNTITIITSHHDKALPNHEHITNNNTTINIYRTGSGRKNFLWYALWFWIQNKHILQSTDHIHTSTFTGAIAANIRARQYKKTISITIHEIYDTQWYLLKWKIAGYCYILYERLLCKYLHRNKIITPSHFTKTCIQNKYHTPDKDIQVIYNQIDYSFWKSEKKKEKKVHTTTKILFIWRAWKEKWLDTLLHAISLVPKRQANITLHIISDTTHTQWKEILHLIKWLSIEDVITWQDPLSEYELQKKIAEYDIWIIPSLSEGFCYTAIEMESMGLSLIASNIPTLVEVLSPKHYFFDVWDSQSLARTILQAINKEKKISDQISVLLIPW